MKNFKIYQKYYIDYIISKQYYDLYIYFKKYHINDRYMKFNYHICIN